MIKKILFSSIMLYTFLGLFSLQAKVITNTFIQNDKNYTLKLSYKKTNLQDQKFLLTYQVYVDNKLLNPNRKKEPWISNDSIVPPEIMPLLSTENQVGWMIISDVTWKNTHSYFFKLLFPYPIYTEPLSFTTKKETPSVYTYQSFLSTKYPLIVPNPYGIELFHYHQELKDKETTASYSVPHNIEFSLYSKIKLKEGDILDKISFLEHNTSNSWFKPSFLGLFKAGLDSKNLPLMCYALEHYYDQNMLELYKVHYKNPTKKNLLLLIEKNKQKLNIKYMHSGYCYGIDTPYPNPKYAKGLTTNLPIEFPKYYKPLTNKLELHAFPTQKTIFQKSYAGFKLILVNPTDKNITITHEDSRFNIIAQAKDTNGIWRDIEHLPHSWCGNSYGTHQLPSLKAWQFSAPIYSGDTKVRLRFKMDNVISNEFDGMINQEQFNIKWQDPNDPFAWLYRDLEK